jgi:signal transduction histidine kinase
LQKLQRENIVPFVKKIIFKGEGIKMNHSENLESTYSPLSGGDRVKVISFFVVLVLGFLWIGFSLALILIVGISIYIMKKDKTFSSVRKAKIYTAIYFVFLAIWVILIFINNSKILTHMFSSIVFILLLVTSYLFFKTLEEHQDWVVKNGIFADKEKAINIIDKDNGKFYSVADELIKWNDLLDKGLITQEEFEEQKKKILNK